MRCALIVRVGPAFSAQHFLLSALLYVQSLVCGFYQVASARSIFWVGGYPIFEAYVKSVIAQGYPLYFIRQPAPSYLGICFLRVG
jgi:hypothetical protein